MREFFRGRKRKAGLLTLAMACTFMGLWVRSEVRPDWFHFSSGKLTTEGFFSFHGNLIYDRFRHSDTGMPPEVIAERGEGIIDYIAVRRLSNEADPFESQLLWNIGGIYQRKATAAEFTLTSLAIPYWSIVAPIALISAYLLLSKPQSSKPTQPVHNA